VSAARASRRFPIGDNWPAFVFVGLLVILVALKGRFTPFDIRSLSVNALPLAFIALGQFLVVLTRGVDLSLGPLASVAGAVMALTVTAHPFVGICAPLLIGLCAGLVNGVFIARLGMPPIIVTLATMSIWQGVALIVLPDPGGNVPRALQEAIAGGFSSPLMGILGQLACIAGGTWLLSSRFGLHLRAVGGDEQAARMSGVRVQNVKTIAYALAGVLAALGGMYLATAAASGSPTAGDSFILTSIAAVVIGGVPLSGGRGTALGVVMGALILTITGSILYFANVSSFYQSVIDGVILLAVVGSGAARDWLRAIAAVRS
jgi:ribose transport system permease protein